MCLLRIFGRGLEASGLLAGLSSADLEASARTSGNQIVVSVSDRDWSDLDGQIADAEEFLARHGVRIRELSGAAEIEALVLDFPVEAAGESAARFLRFPAAFVTAAGALGVGLEISLYDVTKERGPE